MGRRDVGLLLAVAVVDVHAVLLVREVVQVIVSVFSLYKKGIEGKRFARERALQEEIRVPLPVLVADAVRDVAVDVAGISPFGVVEIGLGSPFAVVEVAEEGRFGPEKPHVAVLPDFRGVVSVGFRVAEPVLSGGVHVFRVERASYSPAELVLPQQGGVDGLERTSFQRRLEIVGADGIETGPPRLHVEGAGRGEILGRLEYRTLLSVIDGDGFHVVEREPAEVHRAVLGIAYLYAVEEHPYVLASHAAYIDRLESPDASVILYLYAGEVAERIGHAVAVQLFERLAFEFLGGDDFGCPPCRDDDFLDVVRTVHREGVCRMLRPGAAGEGQQEQQACTDCRPSSPVTYGGSGQR